MNWYFTMVLATLVILAGIFFGGDGNGLPATASAQAPTATVMGTATTFAAAQPTPSSTSSPASTLPDLTLEVSASPDPIMAGQILSYVVTVSNDGASGTPQVWLTGQLPQGTSVQTLGTGCSADPGAGILRCQVSPLAPGENAIFILHLNVSATGGTIGNRFTVDVEGFVTESDETNNTIDKIVVVIPSTAVPTAPVAASPTPTVVATPEPVATQAPAPTEAPVPPPPPPPPAAAQLWVEVLDATPAVSALDEVIWEAQPGEWYWVLIQEADWVLAAWELDPPEAAVWIQIDGRVALSVY